MPAANMPLYQTEVRIPSWKTAPLTKSCQLVGGQNGEPQNFSPDWHQMGTSDYRLTAGAKPRHRIAVEVKPTSGKIDAAKRGVAQSRTYSRKELRSLACACLRGRGECITEGAIQGILSGKTL